MSSKCYGDNYCDLRGVNPKKDNFGGHTKALDGFSMYNFEGGWV